MSFRATFTVIMIVAFRSAIAANWPQWRGPDGTGVGSESEFPIKWSQTENIAWKKQLPGPGNSTPIVWNDRVFITQAIDKGARRAVMCFDRKDGNVLWQKEIAFAGTETTHADNPYCSASPVTDGEMVVAWHGSAGLVAYDFSGKELWLKDLGAFDHIWGNASSPLIYGDKVIAYCGPGLNCFIVALNKKSGGELWRIPLPDAQAKKPGDFFGAWMSPVIRSYNGKTELLAALPNKLVAYNLDTQKPIWSCEGTGPLSYTNPLYGGDTIVYMSGYGGPSIGVRDGGEGDVTASHRLWRIDKGNPQRVGSGVISGDHLYILNEPGTAECIETKTGTSVWKNKVASNSWSSMALCGDKLYAVDMQGTCAVLKASTDFAERGKNALKEMTRASPAFSNGQIFIRTYQNLYCVGQEIGVRR
ncbi:MAG TPA: PQQ-binding-like beta-propeller repeat protein [Planctomycetota bacterium]|nr:PQQ-binding-like beta-propeller repeat protein [Planctomycetota bacterium]